MSTEKYLKNFRCLQKVVWKIKVTLLFYFSILLTFDHKNVEKALKYISKRCSNVTAESNLVLNNITFCLLSVPNTNLKKFEKA